MTQLAASKVLTDAVILGLMSNPTFATEFPHLVAMKKKKEAGCRPCDRGRAVTTSYDFAKIRGAVLALPIDMKARLKMLLGAAKIHVPIVRNNQRSSVTF